jgi:hypothetical protein
MITCGTEVYWRDEKTNEERIVSLLCSDSRLNDDFYVLSFRKETESNIYIYYESYQIKDLELMEFWQFDEFVRSVWDDSQIKYESRMKHNEEKVKKELIKEPCYDKSICKSIYHFVKDKGDKTIDSAIILKWLNKEEINSVEECVKLVQSPLYHDIYKLKDLEYVYEKIKEQKELAKNDELITIQRFSEKYKVSISNIYKFVRENDIVHIDLIRRSTSIIRNRVSKLYKEVDLLPYFDTLKRQKNKQEMAKVNKDLFYKAKFFDETKIYEEGTYLTKIEFAKRYEMNPNTLSTYIIRQKIKPIGKIRDSVSDRLSNIYLLSQLKSFMELRRKYNQKSFEFDSVIKVQPTEEEMNDLVTKREFLRKYHNEMSIATISKFIFNNKLESHGINMNKYMTDSPKAALYRVRDLVPLLNIIPRKKIAA